MFKKICNLLFLILAWGILILIPLLANAYFKNNNIDFWKFSIKHYVLDQPRSEVLGVSTLGDEASFEYIPVLLYHGIVKEPDNVNIFWKDFINQMEALNKAGYETINSEQLAKLLNGENIEMYKKPIMISFDDGRKDSYYYSDFIFKELDFKAVMFVIINKQINNDPFFLSWDELKQMSESGRWDIQSHGKAAHEFIDIDNSQAQGHFLSNKLWLEDEQRLETNLEFQTRIYRDLLSSKRFLEYKLDVDISGLAYPFGDYGQKSENFPGAEDIIFNAVKEIYDMAFYQTLDVNYLGDNSFMIKRIKVESEWTDQYLLDILEEK